MNLLFDPKHNEHALAIVEEPVEGSFPAPAKAKSTYLPRYVLDNSGKVVDRYPGKSDEEATALFDAMIEERRAAAEAAAETVRKQAAAIVTRLAYFLRFTTEERIAINASDDARVRDFIQLANLAEEINLLDANTIAGTHYLESKGLLAAGRAVAILGAK